ncbi:MAG: SPOR domain-containing protein [Candidatus Omnitrophota bacterium]
MRKVIIFLILLFWYQAGYCLQIDKVKVYFLNQDFKSAIKEGERLLAVTSHHTSGSDELYYLLGLSYLKDGNYLRASDIFEIILKELPKSNLKDEARLGLGDAYYLKGDYSRAEKEYRALLDKPGTIRLRPSVLYRLSQINFKNQDIANGKDYLNKLKNSYPSSFESRVNQELCPVAVAAVGGGIYYTVQVGSFSRNTNANNLVNKLIAQGYPAYVEGGVLNNKATYRVRVGRFFDRNEAVALEKRLAKAGYPTKICP